MSGFESVIPLAVSAASTIAGASRQAKANDAAVQAADQRQAALVADYQAREHRRQNLLEQAMASQRARLGALGIGSAGGSGDALLAGMASRSAEDSTDDAAGVASSMGVLQSQMAARSGGSSLLSLANNLMPVATKIPGAFAALDTGGDTGGGDLGFSFGA
ncbi:MAG: hypothetical protein ACM31L_03940 [Actinomycetota bacterium]